MKCCIAVLAFMLVASLAPSPTVVQGASDGSTTAERWAVWRADLDYLYGEIEKPSSLKQILESKGIDWRAIEKEADKRLRKQAKAFEKRRKNDALEESVAFYGILNYVVGQLRDSHAYLRVDDEIVTAWKAAQPKFYDAGIEFQPGAGGLILVSNTFAARGSNSPLYGKGVRHAGTYLESVDGVPATKYFEQRARAKYEQEGWQSTYGRAYIEALNGLDIAEGEGLKLVFKTLAASEKTREQYLAASPSKRAKAFKSLKWKTQKVSLRASECLQTRNPRNFVFMGLESPEMTETVAKGVWYGRLATGTGFVRYNSVSRKSRAGLDQACRALADCPGLVLDMRTNGGGGGSGVGAFHKTEGSWDKPLAVLMGPKAMSAAETEIWTLRDMRAARTCNVRFFGQTTAGASGAKIQFELPSGFAKGQFVFRHWLGGRSTIEGQGIEPDEVVLQNPVELSLGIDSCIARAEGWLARQNEE